MNLLQELREGGIEAIERALGPGGTVVLQRGDGSERPRIETRVEHGDLGAGRRDAVPMCARHPFDESK